MRWYFRLPDSINTDKITTKICNCSPQCLNVPFKSGHVLCCLACCGFNGVLQKHAAQSIVSITRQDAAELCPVHIFDNFFVVILLCFVLVPYFHCSVCPLSDSFMSCNSVDNSSPIPSISSHSLMG